MQWKKITAGVAQTYQLIEGNNTLVTISINHGSSILRAMSKSIQRVFFIHKEGFWKNRTVLKNEYGQRIGKLYYEKSHADTGIVEIEDKKFQYTFRNGPSAEIAVFTEGETNPVVACELVANEGQTMTKLNRDGNFADRDMQYILFALSWYLFLPVAQKHDLAYAV
jgi:hypothetical protein